MRARDVEALRSEREALADRIARHPFNRIDVRRARDVIESRRGAPTAETDLELVSLGLPTIAEVGRLTLAEVVSWGRLQRRMRKLDRRIGRLESE